MRQFVVILWSLHTAGAHDDVRHATALQGNLCATDTDTQTGQRHTRYMTPGGAPGGERDECVCVGGGGGGRRSERARVSAGPPSPVPYKHTRAHEKKGNPVCPLPLKKKKDVPQTAYSFYV